MRLLLQLVGIRWEGKVAGWLLFVTISVLLMSEAFTIRRSLKSVCLFYRRIVKAGAENSVTTVPASAVGPNNLDGRISFDDTVANFDIDVSDPTSQSDLIFD